MSPVSRLFPLSLSPRDLLVVEAPRLHAYTLVDLLREEMRRAQHKQKHDAHTCHAAGFARDWPTTARPRR